MKIHFIKKCLIAGTALALLISLAGCGQKGPLIVEQPPIDAPQIQDEELAPVK